MSRNKPLTNFIMSVNGVQKCILLRIFKQLERLRDLARMLSLANYKKVKTKTDLLIKIVSYVGQKSNE